MKKLILFALTVISISTVSSHGYARYYDGPMPLESDGGGRPGMPLESDGRDGWDGWYFYDCDEF